MNSKDPPFTFKVALGARLIITGAIFGGFLTGMGAEVFILPYCESIAGNPICVFSLFSASCCGGMIFDCPDSNYPKRSGRHSRSSTNAWPWDSTEWPID